jgi:hypothetical protein
MKQAFEAPEAQPPLGTLAAVTGGTVEVNMWTPAQWTPFPTGPGSNNYLTPGQQWILDASGIMTLVSGTVAMTARLGTSATPASNLIFGAASGAATGTAATAQPWILRGLITVRAVGLPGANSTLHGRFRLDCPAAFQAAGNAGSILFGGTITTGDVSIAQGLAFSFTPSVSTTSFTTEQISWRSIG